MFNWYYVTHFVVAGHIKKSVAVAAFHVYNTSGFLPVPPTRGQCVGDLSDVS